MGTAVRVSKEEFGIRRASSGSPELDTFLSGGFPSGSLILVSGNPGTGKTTLTSSFLYEGSKRRGENGIYVSFSESKKSFYQNMAAIGMDFEKLEKAGHFRFLEMFSATREGMSEIAKFILEEIKRFGAKRLVIDSYSVMAQALGNQYEGRQVLHTFFSRIMRNMDCTTLVIGEQPTGEYRIGDASEEFVADGVINLKLTIPREMEIRKMRGTKLSSRNLLYTLEGGFNVVTTVLRHAEVAKMWQPIPDSKGRLSSGSPDLDAILGGGFPEGTYVVLEVANDVPVREVRLLTRGIVLNFISQERGAMMIPTRGVDSGDIKASFGRYVSEQNFDAYMRIQQQIEPAPSKNGARAIPPYAIPIMPGLGNRGTRNLTTASLTFDAAEEILKKRTENRPIARIIAYDTLEGEYAQEPDKLLNEIGLAMTRTRTRGDLTIAIGRPSFGLLPKVVGMVDWHIKLWKADGVLLLQGVKPSTNIYAADCDVSKGYPVLTLKMLT
ncbi:MAG: AAA family ATPase [Thaumarchaeota archaeon]|nr:AAA family ATPase [Nitrososphaerota archaeon]